MEQYTVYLNLSTAQHVSGGIFTHHQELISLLPVVDMARREVPVQPRSRQVAVIRAPDDGWKYHPKHVEQFADINKLYIVASCWIIIDTHYAMHGSMNIKFIFTLLK